MLLLILWGATSKFQLIIAYLLPWILLRFKIVSSKVLARWIWDDENGDLRMEGASG
jgi:hypothetical protein